MSENPYEPRRGDPARGGGPRLQPRGLDRPPVDPQAAEVFGRPAGVTGSFDDEQRRRSAQGVQHAGGTRGAAPPPALTEAFGRSPEDAGVILQRPPGDDEQAGVFGTATPAFSQSTVVAGFSSGELTAYRYENGQPVWQDALSRTGVSTVVGTISDIDADPVIDQGRVFAIGQGGRMVAVELITGQRAWEINIAGISTPWVAGDWVFVVTDDAKLVAIARNTGKIRWINQLPAWLKMKAKRGPISYVGPVLAGDRLIVAGSNGVLVNVLCRHNAFCGSTSCIPSSRHTSTITIMFFNR